MANEKFFIPSAALCLFLSILVGQVSGDCVSDGQAEPTLVCQGITDPGQLSQRSKANFTIRAYVLDGQFLCFVYCRVVYDTIQIKECPELCNLPVDAFGQASARRYDLFLDCPAFSFDVGFAGQDTEVIVITYKPSSTLSGSFPWDDLKSMDKLNSLAYTGGLAQDLDGEECDYFISVSFTFFKFLPFALQVSGPSYPS